MSVSLNATLQTAQDGADHAPRCKIVSSAFTGDIPFGGQLFNDDSVNETDPAMIVTTAGRLAAVYVKGNDLYYKYSDTDRTTWYETEIYNGDDAGYPVIDCCLVELTSGNLGIVFFSLEGSNNYHYYMIISPTGAIVTAATLIESWGAYTHDGPALCEISTGYMLIYKVKASGVYYLYKRTCDASFTTWGNDAAISVPGLSSTRDRNHCSLLAAASGRKYLFFEYLDAIDGDNEQRNIYYTYSTDNGATWSTAAALTTYADYTASGRHPYVAAQTDNDIVIAYHEDVNVLILDKNSAGYCTSEDANENLWGAYLHYDPASQNLFIVGAWLGSGPNALARVLVVDATTWTITKCYKQDGSPGWDDVWTDAGHIERNSTSCDGQYIAVAASDWRILLIDHNTQTVKEYYFQDDVTYNVTGNIDGPYGLPYYQRDSITPFIDAANNRLWIGWAGESVTVGCIEIGYIELDDTGDPITGNYQYHTHYSDVGFGPYSVESENCYLSVYPEYDKILFGFVNYASNWKGALWVVSISTGSLVKYYNESDYSQFHYRGIGSPIMIGNVIYGSVRNYEPSYGQSARRGLAIIDLDTDAITYERPTYSPLRDDYYLKNFVPINNNSQIMMGSYDGVVIYDVTAKTWSTYNSDNVAGFLTTDYVRMGAYNEDENIIYTAANNAQGYGEYRVIGFKQGGALYRGKYIIGTVNGDHYDFAAAANLHRDFGGYDLTVAYDDDNSLWNIWSLFDGAEHSLMWARSDFAPDLAGYLSAGAPVSISWEIGRPATASFSLARGDLFDPTNTSSIFSVLCQKGRKMTISFGEQVSGTTYWQQQGIFVVTATRLTYSRSQHPVIKVLCEDRSGAWPELIVTATEGYRAESLDNIFTDVLENVANLESADYSIPTLSNDHVVYGQWVDESLKDVIDDILNHFGAFGHWGTDGIYTLREIDLTAAVDHDYTGAATTPLYDFTPDDRSSSQINRVTVRCEGLTDIEVLWDEQRIESINGTVGFWSKEDQITVHYSNDSTRRCRYPRLHVIQSINDYSALISMLGGHGDEYISDEDVDETYCVVSVEAPDRGLYVFGFAAAVAGFGASALGCETRFTCGVNLLLTNLALSALIQSLAAADYRYDLYARPIGHEKQMFQASANDTQLQNDMGGLVINHDIEDALCNTVAHCQMVADHELAVVKAQRRRITFTKAAHLQDEIGDIIKVKHPISGLDLSAYIAKLTRTFSKPSGAGAGRFDDQIDAWRIVS